MLEVADCQNDKPVVSGALVVKGRIVDFLIDRDKTGYAEFIFKSDYDKDCPRFEAICSGKIPDVVPGVPMKVEFQVNDISEIKKVDFREQRIEKVTRNVRQKYINHLLYSCINYNDEVSRKKTEGHSLLL